MSGKPATADTLRSAFVRYVNALMRDGHTQGEAAAIAHQVVTDALACMFGLVAAGD